MLLILLVSGLLLQLFASAIPQGAQIVSNTSETNTPQTAGSLATAGGTFTTMIINGSTQTPRWKAYVGNVTGSLTLDDATGKSIYDWRLLTIAGEIYASRSSAITWTAINCSNRTIISTEESVMNITTTNADSINKTFNMSIHKQFYVGGLLMRNSTCPAIATYVNDTRQSASENASFQEVLLTDGTSMIYSALLEPGLAGFDNGKYNFQMIVAENEYAPAPTPYYFYLELS